MNNKISEINNKSNIVLEKIPEITYIGNPILRKISTSVTFEEGVEVGKQLLEILLRYRELTGVGVGLAAPQIDSSANVFVTCVDNTPKIFINPEITFYSEQKNLYKENCLSSPHVWCDVERSENILISYINEEGEKIIDESHDQFSARLIQHEYDHLQGIVNIDKAVVGTIDYKTGEARDQKLR